jgi:hypothetical protein
MPPVGAHVARQADHQHPVNQACHWIGIPLIAASS